MSLFFWKAFQRTQNYPTRNRLWKGSERGIIFKSERAWKGKIRIWKALKGWKIAKIVYEKHMTGLAAIHLNKWKVIHWRIMCLSYAFQVIFRFFTFHVWVQTFQESTSPFHFRIFGRFWIILTRIQSKYIHSRYAWVDHLSFHQIMKTKLQKTTIFFFCCCEIA